MEFLLYCECGTNKWSYSHPEGILTHWSVMTSQIKIFIISSKDCENGVTSFSTKLFTYFMSMWLLFWSKQCLSYWKVLYLNWTCSDFVTNMYSYGVGPRAHLVKNYESHARTIEFHFKMQWQLGPCTARPTLFFKFLFHVE